MGKYFNKENCPFDTEEIFGFSSSLPKSLPIPSYGQVNPGYGGLSRILSLDQQVQPVQTLTPAGKSPNLFYMVKYYFFFDCLDLLCRGQQPETVIPLETGRKFVVCLDESKGVEQQCPKGLFYHPISRRCERSMFF
jgi:hypothetical protein